MVGNDLEAGLMLILILGLSLGLQVWRYHNHHMSTAAVAAPRHAADHQCFTTIHALCAQQDGWVR